MKIHGFNKLSPTGNDPKAHRSVDRSVSDDSNGRKILKKTDPGKSRKTAFKKDRIELTANRAAVEDSKITGHISDIKYPMVPEEAKDVTYSPESVSGSVKNPIDPSREVKLSKIRQNIAEGYYNSPEFIEKLADKLINKFYLTGDSE
jgi:hypothetical protein